MITAQRVCQLLRRLLGLWAIQHVIDITNSNVAHRLVLILAAEKSKIKL